MNDDRGYPLAAPHAAPPIGWNKSYSQTRFRPHIFPPTSRLSAILTSISSPRNGKVDARRYSRSNGTRCTRYWRQYRHRLYYLSGKHIPNGHSYEASSDDVVSNYSQKEPKYISRDASRKSPRTPSKGSRKRRERTTCTCYLLTFPN